MSAAAVAIWVCVSDRRDKGHSEIRLALSTDRAGRPVRTQVNTDIGWFLRDAPLSPWPYKRRSSCFSLHWTLCVDPVCLPTFFQSLNCRHTEGRTLGRSTEEGDRRTANGGIRGGRVGTKCSTPQPNCISMPTPGKDKRKGFFYKKLFRMVVVDGSMVMQIENRSLQSPIHLYRDLNFMYIHLKHIFVIIIVLIIYYCLCSFNIFQNDREEASVFCN